MDDFVIARNPEEGTTLPFLVRLPLGRDGVVLKVRDTWPRTQKVYCHPAVEWPAEPDIVERVAVTRCVRRGASIDLVLDRGRENRSMFVFSRARGREVIFWQSARTAKQARPNVSLPTARASGQVLDIVVDSHERYAWSFAHQQATTTKRALPAGDYAVEHDGVIVAAVERKSLADFVSTLTGGKLSYVMAALASVRHGAVVVEDRYSAVFKLERVRPSIVAEGTAEAQVRFPTVPIIFAETRSLAQEWTFRFFGAALAQAAEAQDAEPMSANRLTLARPLAAVSAARTKPLQASWDTRRVPAATIRTWARSVGLEVADRGRIHADITEAFRIVHAAEAHDPGHDSMARNTDR